MSKSDKQDFDDLLSQATEPRENSPRSGKAVGERSVTRDRIEEGRGKFKIDQRDKNLSGGLPSFRNGARLEVDPESFTNEVEAYESRRKRKFWFILAGIIVIALVFIWGITLLFPHNEIHSNKTPEAVNSSQKFLTSYPNAPQPHIDQMTLKTTGHKITTLIGSTSTGWSLIFKDLSFSELPGCSVTQVADFSRCVTTDPKDPFAGAQIWLTKDAVHSSLFASARNFKTVEVSGAKAAATMTLPGLSPEPRAALVIVTQDVVGYIIILPAKATLADATALAQTTLVE